jgi:hypothetical protein
MVWNEEKKRGSVKLSRETACARLALSGHNKIDDIRFSAILSGF